MCQIRGNKPNSLCWKRLISSKEKQKFVATGTVLLKAPTDCADKKKTNVSVAITHKRANSLPRVNTVMHVSKKYQVLLLVKIHFRVTSR